MLAVKCLALAEGVGLAIAAGKIVRPEATVLPIVDHRRKRARWPAFLVYPFGVDQLLDQPQLVVSVEDGKIRLEARQFRMPTQHLGADRMEGAQPLHPFNHAADQETNTLL